MVVDTGPLDVRLLSHLCRSTLEETRGAAMEINNLMTVVQKYFSEFSTEQLAQLEQLGPLYKEWNEKINVISRKDIDSLYEKHVLHSLAIAAVFEFLPGTKIIDIGTGGGFPGIPLAIYFPEVEFHLVDSIGKKIKVVQGIAEAIGLKNLTAQHTRAEDIKNRKFDFVVSRAVAPLKELWQWGKPLLNKTIEGDEKAVADHVEVRNGLICLKGGDLTQEISESRLKPRAWQLEELYEEEFFREKYLLYVER
jgi:16S rRNA (guanine527-N7)-methyltransferase